MPPSAIADRRRARRRRPCPPVRRRPLSSRYPRRRRRPAWALRRPQAVRASMRSKRVRPLAPRRRARRCGRRSRGPRRAPTHARRRKRRRLSRAGRVRYGQRGNTAVNPKTATRSPRRPRRRRVRSRVPHGMQRPSPSATRVVMLERSSTVSPSPPATGPAFSTSSPGCFWPRASSCLHSATDGRSAFPGGNDRAPRACPLRSTRWQRRARTSRRPLLLRRAARTQSACLQRGRNP